MQEEWNSEDGAGRLVGGAITWEVEGGRREVQLEVAELLRGGRLERVGLWAPRAGLSWQRHDPPADTPPPESMTNRTFTVLIAKVRASPQLRETHRERLLHRAATTYRSTTILPAYIYKHLCIFCFSVSEQTVRNDTRIYEAIIWE